MLHQTTQQHTAKTCSQDEHQAAPGSHTAKNHNIGHGNRDEGQQTTQHGGPDNQFGSFHEQLLPTLPWNGLENSRFNTSFRLGIPGTPVAIDPSVVTSRPTPMQTG
jgi:hypothetical protein